ncbi:MAG: Uma2 family endonuclease [Roseofilum sp. SBFL]|uniref:Uma2 family endonuclease n=1 Tax=unclassified Roseofilum TaxID=2620099 RepID=UPI001B0FB89A|nr:MULTISPECIES: Uma2 family endonuclease [unclassified Roseofilum]MBP0015176.1 Uma2 family endonuclease [Roseofilum sp. SID3]MBP0024452.1 Uma2 family endonuclease [Roseofilum sp. SID2]MBP0038729.1 Uma2 family endonuclease [Roseofilum sp. SID1]MBP0044636.1 Uma2 family endonuclease [Roseofilum sp. SBFL]
MISGIATHQQNTLGEQRLILHGLAWENYQHILHGLPESRAVRLIYNRGTLEFVMPLEDHEFAAELIGVFIRVLVATMGLKLKSMRSTTLARQDLDRGAEPDNAYYIQNQPQVAGRKVDLQQDPPPDLVVEVDITHTDIDKNQLYAALGVPEFWRYNGQEWRIYQLQGTVYQEWERSPTFPIIKKEDLYRFLEQAQEDEIAAEEALRQLIQERII